MNKLFSPYASEKDKLNRFINSFGTQSFRDQADRDYIAARLAGRYELFPQFLWAAQQAMEKYLKAIFLFNRIDARQVRHDLSSAMMLTKKLPFIMQLSDKTRKFIDHLSVVGEYRYIDVPYYVYGYALIDLDVAVWEIRRYCQVFDPPEKFYSDEERMIFEEAAQQLTNSENNFRCKFKINGGLLEKFLDDKKSASRAALIWQNPCFSNRARKTVRAKSYLTAQNPMLYLYPEMLEELMKYVFIPKGLAAKYRQHLEEIKDNKKNRP